MTIKQATRIYLCTTDKEAEQFINGARWMEHKAIDWFRDNVTNYIWWDSNKGGQILIDTMLLDFRKVMDK